MFHQTLALRTATTRPPAARQSVIALLSPPLVVGELEASSATNGSTIAKIALAPGKISVTRGRIRRKIGLSNVKIVGRTFVIHTMTTVPGPTSGKIIRMLPGGT